MGVGIEGEAVADGQTDSDIVPDIRHVLRDFHHGSNRNELIKFDLFSLLFLYPLDTKLQEFFDSILRKNPQR